MRASASHERRDSGVGIAEGALEHGELVAVAPELLAHGGACASQPSDGAVTAHVQLGLAARGVSGKSHEVLDGWLLTSTVVTVPTGELELSDPKVGLDVEESIGRIACG